ncbi:hypothetical protein GGR51DRAFT_553281 [Nemania sp. FL0031]|nr:hypothetical protein GGR51DRAFT_553281 [Nemania sp. FL0031]
MHFPFASFALAALAAGHINYAKPKGPYLISITGKTNSSIKGYAKACHASAAQEGLCYDEPPRAPESDPYYLFFYSAPPKKDLLSGRLIFGFMGPDGEEEVMSTVQIDQGLGSNVNRAIISVSLDSHTNFFVDNNNPEGNIYITGLVDDSHWNQTRPEQFGQWVGFYWYYSVAWVTTLPPHNPSCEPVDLKLVDWNKWNGTETL